MEGGLRGHPTARTRPKYRPGEAEECLTLKALPCYRFVAGFLVEGLRGPRPQALRGLPRQHRP